MVSMDRSRRFRAACWTCEEVARFFSRGQDPQSRRLLRVRLHRARNMRDDTALRKKERTRACACVRESVYARMYVCM